MTPEQAARLRRALLRISTGEVPWDQPNYALTFEEPTGDEPPCGTAFCLAGDVVANDLRLRLRWQELRGHDRAEGGTFWSARFCYDANGVERDIEDVAAEALGLTNRQAFDLFSPGNDLDELWGLAREYSGGLVNLNRETVDVQRGVGARLRYPSSAGLR